MEQQITPETQVVRYPLKELTVPKSVLKVLGAFIQLNVAYLLFIYLIPPEVRRVYLGWTDFICNYFKYVDGVYFTDIEMQKLVAEGSILPDQVALARNIITFTFVSGIGCLLLALRYLKSFIDLRLRLLDVQDARTWLKTETKYTGKVFFLACLGVGGGLAYCFLKPSPYGISSLIYNVPTNFIPLLGRALMMPVSAVSIVYLLSTVICSFVKRTAE